jgi:transcriptional regulator with XRE-family HTH domain
VKSLAELRKENNLTQRKLADLLGVSSGAIGMYESGMRTPSLKQVRKIANLFGISSDEIFFKSAANTLQAKDPPASAQPTGTE